MKCFDATIWWIFLCTLGQNMAFAVISPILSLQFDNEGISSIAIGFIFATYSLAIILWSPVVSTTLL